MNLKKVMAFDKSASERARHRPPVDPKKSFMNAHRRAEAFDEWVKPEYRVGCELGVKEGGFTKYLLEKHDDLVMVNIDPRVVQDGSHEDYARWDWNRINEIYDTVLSLFPGRIIEYREYSYEAVKKIEDGSLDFIFIDAQHDYESVKRDIELFFPKVREGGLFAGHDYASHWCGVVQAVHEAFEGKYEIMTKPKTVTWGIYK